MTFIDIIQVKKFFCYIIKNMNKFLKQFFINILICFIIYQLIEICAFGIGVYKAYMYIKPKGTFISYANFCFKNFYFNKYKSWDKIYEKTPFRPIEGVEYSEKKPIIIFGCSFAYGSDLEDNQTFSYKLSNHLKQKVYNRAYLAWSVQNMLYQAKRADFYDIVQEEPDKVIYVYILGHVNRLMSEVWIFDTQIFYKLSKNKIKESFIKSGGIFYGFFEKFVRKYYVEEIALVHPEKSKIYNLLSSVFEESQDEFKKHWKNTKYYILVYSASDEEKKVLEGLGDKGFNVIFLQDLTSENLDSVKYQISDTDNHPNEAAWDLLTPLIAKKINE